MKKLFTILILALLSITTFAQSPQKMTYQAVVRDASGNLITNHAVGMRLSILQGSASGTVVYAETQTSTTNSNGLLSIELGGGNVISGDFALINWANGPYFIKTETDPTGGTNYSITGTSQLLSVPYALYAKTSENGFSGNYNDLTNKPTTDGSETKVQAGTNITVTGSGTNANPYIVNSSNSGTGITGTIIGDLQYWNGTTWVILHPGTTGQVLTLNSSNIPVWQTNSGGSSASIPQLSTTIISSITATSAVTGGNITSDGGYSVTARGVCWSTSPNPTTADSKTTDGSGGGSFTSYITGLMGSTIYYLRAYASNSIGTGYGMTLTFTTSAPSLPTVTTNSITNITQTTAKSGGNVTNNGGANVTARGVCWSTSSGPTINNYKTIDSSGNGSFVSNLTGLNYGTTYYLQSYATNSAGTAYGYENSFTTLPILPILSTNIITSITSTSAICGGSISNNGGSIISSGVCWSTSPNPTILNSKTTDGSITGSFASYLTNLTPNTVYYVRAYATNIAGTAYGNQLYFSTLNPVITDIDGNFYDTVQIGTQIWMKQNLKTTKYRNGDNIPNVTNNTSWTNLTTGAYCNNNDTNIANIYGRLYNNYAVADLRNLCPLGWHVASDAEWTTLTNYLGGLSIAGGKLKEAGLLHWQSPNTSATNESGFTAIPGGSRSYDGSYGMIGSSASFWTSTAPDINHAWYRSLSYNSNQVTRDYNYGLRYLGYSVRCIRDSSNQVSVPIITTDSIINKTTTSAKVYFNLVSDGGASIITKGACWSTSPNPTITNSQYLSGVYFVNINSLLPGTTYYVRAFATNNAGTSYGNQLMFNTLTLPSVFDIDGNGYDTVQIGTQTWMKQNLKTTKYRNGDAIPNITNNTTWGSLTTGAYCNYNNNDTNMANTYGRLYNFYSVADTRNLCPAGWHVPTDAEWTTLTTYLGGESIAGCKLKEVGLAHWASLNTGATNETGFTAFPAGARIGETGEYVYLGSYGEWWSSTQYNTNYAWDRFMANSYCDVGKSHSGKKAGYSVRCLKD